MSLSGSQGLKNGGGAASQLAPNATGGNLILSGTSTAQQFVSTQLTAAVAYLIQVAGARLKFSAGGTTDYLSSDGAQTITAAGVLAALVKMSAGAPANSTQLELRDSTNAQTFNFVVNNTTCSLFDNGATNEIMRWTNAGGVRVLRDITYASFTDDSATPGNRTVNTARGKSAFAIGAATVTITNSFVTTASQVICVLEFGDVTLTQILRCVPGVGSFVVTGNAVATAATKFSWLVIN